MIINPARMLVEIENDGLVTVNRTVVSDCLGKWDMGTGNEGGVISITTSPDEQWMASSDDTGVVILWDLETGAELLRDNSHDGWCTQVAFSLDGQTIYSVGVDGILVAWQVGNSSLSEVIALIENNRYLR